MYCPRPIVLIWQKNQFIGGQEAVYTTQVDNSGSDYQAQWHFHFLSPIVLRGLPSKYKVFLQKQELHPLPPCQATSAGIFNTFQCVKLFASWRQGSSHLSFNEWNLLLFDAKKSIILRIIPDCRHLDQQHWWSRPSWCSWGFVGSPAAQPITSPIRGT